MSLTKTILSKKTGIRSSVGVFMFFVLLVHSKSQNIDISPINNVRTIDYGDTILIPTLTIKEATGYPGALGFNTTTGLTLHTLVLEVSGGFVFDATNPPTVVKTGTDISNPSPEIASSDENTLTYTFEVSGTGNQNTITFSDICLKAGTENTAPAGILTATVDTAGTSTSLSQETVGTYTMANPSLNLPYTSQECANDTIPNLTILGTLGTLTTDESLVVETIFEYDFFGKDSTIIDTIPFNAATDTIIDLLIDTIAYEDIQALYLRLIFDNDSVIADSITIGNSNDTIERLDYNAISFSVLPDGDGVKYVNGEYILLRNVGERYVEFSEILDDYPTNYSEFTITASDPVFLTNNDQDQRFLPDVAGAGTHIVSIVRGHPISSCKDSVALKIIVIPDIIVAKDVFCYTPGQVETIKVSIDAITNLSVSNYVSTSFNSLAISGYGHDTTHYAADRTDQGFYEFDFYPSDFLDNAFGDSLKKDINLLIKVEVDAEFRRYGDYFCSDYNISGFDCNFEIWGPCGFISYRCRDLVTYTVQLNVGQKASKITLPRKDGWLADMEDNYCQGNGKIRLWSERTIDSIWSATIDTSILYTNGIYELDLSAFSPDTNTVTDIVLEYQDVNTCSMDTTIHPTIHAVPVVEFVADTKCEGDPQPFVQVSPDSLWVNIVGWEWDFGDNYSVSNLYSDEDTITKNNTFGSYKSPSHLYEAPEKYTVTLTVKSEEECENSDTASIIVGKYPVTSIADSGTIVDRNVIIKNNTKVAKYDPAKEFYYQVTNPQGILTRYTLDNKDSIVFQPEQHGVYYVSLRSTSNNNCVTFDQLFVPVFPIVPLSNDNSYMDEFKSEELPDGWLHSKDYPQKEDSARLNSNWKSVPLEGKFMDDNGHDYGYLWLAGDPTDNKTNELGWLESPCFDLSEVDFPLLSLDIYQSIRTGQNGAVVEYSINGGLTWNLLGKTGDGSEGTNWYNTSGIISSPGSNDDIQSGANVGWSDNNEVWETARFPLDLIRDENTENHCVRFRVVYESYGPSQESDTLLGFGINNFYFGKRKRPILIEQFLRNKNEGPLNEELWLDSLVHNNAQEIFVIKYHLGDVGYDPELYMVNWRDISARASEYYQLSADTNKMATILDGLFAVEGEAENGIKDAYEKRVLADPDFDIDNVIITEEGNGIRISADITKLNYRPEDVYGENSWRTVRIAIIQTDYESENGDLYKDVLIELLPNQGGHSVYDLPIDMMVGQTINVSDKWVPNVPVDGNSFKVAVYVQSMADYNEVHQLWHDTIPASVMGNITSLDDILGYDTGLNFSLYPNPVKEKVLVDITGGIHEDATWELYNTSGLCLSQGILTRGIKRFIINTDELPDGIYILQLKTESGQVESSKLIKSK